jgi:hypothetical protein
MFNDVQNARILCQATNTDAVGVLAIDVFNSNIGRISLEGEAVVSRNDVGVPKGKVRGAVGAEYKEVKIAMDRVEKAHLLPSISVLWSVLVCRQRREPNVRIGHILAVNNPVEPVRGIFHSNIVDCYFVSPIESEKHWTAKGTWQENLLTSSGIPPCLTRAIN